MAASKYAEAPETHQVDERVTGHPPTIIDRQGRLLPSLENPDAGIAIASQEACGAVDCWHEYLCAFRGDWGFTLNIYRYEWLGEVPEEWFDEDGEPLPEHRDANGELKLPEEWEYQSVFGHRYGGFIGQLVPAYGTDDVQISDWSEEMVREALGVLRWPDEAIGDVQEALRRLAGVDVGVPDEAVEERNLVITHFSVVVKRSAVARSFPGGVEEFDRVRQPARSNADLSVLVTMSMDDANHIFQKLHQGGLVPGEDFGLVDMQQGVLVPCHGIRVVERHDDELGMVHRRSAEFDPSYRYLPEDVALRWQPPEHEPEPKPAVEAIKPPSGLTAHQYYQWRGLQRWPEDDEEE